MSLFTVIDIIDYNTIKVEPRWKFQHPIKGTQIVGEDITIIGLPKIVNNYMKRRLSSLIKNRQVNLIDPVLLSAPNDPLPKIGCMVTIDGTNVTYYFPEYASEQVSAEV